MVRGTPHTDEYNATYSAESGVTHTAETVKQHWLMLYGTSFGKVSIDGATLSWSDVGSSVVQSCTYVASPCTTVWYSGPNNTWSLEESADAWSEVWCGFKAGSDCGDLNQLVMTEFQRTKVRMPTDQGGSNPELGGLVRAQGEDQPGFHVQEAKGCQWSGGEARRDDRPGG